VTIVVDKLSERFDQLANDINAIEATKRVEHSELGSYTRVDRKLALSWVVKVKNLLVSACGETSQHYKEFEKAEEIRGYEYYYDAFERMTAVFSAAREDYKGGFLTSLRNLIQAEIFDTELEQARELLNSGYKVAAAVIAGIVLETTLRDICTRQGLPMSKLDKMNSDIAKTGLYNKLQQKRITALADIRNSAAHGKPQEFTENDVKDMIRDVEQFLANYLT
jgi:hypothetical protein